MIWQKSMLVSIIPLKQIAAGNLQFSRQEIQENPSSERTIRKRPSQAKSIT